MFRSSVALQISALQLQLDRFHIIAFAILHVWMLLESAVVLHRLQLKYCCRSGATGQKLITQPSVPTHLYVL